MKNKDKNQSLGAWIKFLSWLNIIIGIAGLGMMVLALYSPQAKDSMELKQFNNIQLIIFLVFILASLVGAILILRKNELGIYLFFGAEILSFVYSIVISGFNLKDLGSLIVPLFYAYLIYKKRHLFGFSK